MHDSLRDTPPDPLSVPAGLRVAYHAACALQHGQKIKALPKTLLAQAGFNVLEPADSHLCCGAAGTYNLLQPALAGQLRDRRAASPAALVPDVIAAGNLACMMQVGQAMAVPVVHTVALLDWATGRPPPPAMARAPAAMAVPEPVPVPILR